MHRDVRDAVPYGDAEKRLYYSRRDTAYRVRSDYQTQPIISTLSLQTNFSVGRVPTRPIRKNCIAIFAWTRLAVSLRQLCYNSNAKLWFILIKVSSYN